MKTRLIFVSILLMSVAGLRGQDLLRPDSGWERFIKPPPIHETLKPPVYIDDLQKNPLDIFAPLPATWSQFKCTFLDLPLPEEFALVERFHRNIEMGKNYPASIWFDPEDHFRTVNKFKNVLTYGTGGSVIPGVGLSTSVIQAMYDQYSHEGKMRRKYDSLVAQDNIEYQLYPKYNVALVKQITGFTSDSTAYAFIKFCDFKNDSLLQANNYDVYLMIQNCLSQFLRQRP
ncbi:MAG: hypothetical protein FWF09_02485 [Bacteroidales bacterium]|nr:hypothetical protein [Bacteroidales bacterium]